MREATRVEAYRVAPPSGSNPMEDYTSPLDYEVASEPVVVSAVAARELSEALLSPETYNWGSAKACGGPVYGVKLSFFKGSERVDVYFCFQCSVLAVVRDDRVFGGGDFDNAEPLFIRAAKKLFPHDAAIQEIRP